MGWGYFEGRDFAGAARRLKVPRTETETGPVLPPLVMTAAGPVYPDLVFGTGLVALPTGALDADGLPILAPTEGCHVNLLAPDGWPLPEPLAGKVVTPGSPVCVFVG